MTHISRVVSGSELLILLQEAGGRLVHSFMYKECRLQIREQLRLMLTTINSTSSRRGFVMSIYSDHVSKRFMCSELHYYYVEC